MGFGSYDESEQERQQSNDGEEEAEGVDAHEHEHDGEVNVESDVSTNALVDRLGEMKDDPEDESEDA
ncbi:hypothetical protein C474_00265 [Halogeometricum pallidum JCM 14848]|uniref:DUF5786 domain-containing protein n=1 Tax=Halogeometricum pallidum JCM 14848 TaxID=1227487 RepID=M0DLQ0_HALPD|nr:DUF5786 family protein [Halogeometricum pallidum]ELZ35059.1 hypothetical protein C474_00265 [Halogeometricum pallidum JCM 14848]